MQTNPSAEPLNAALTGRRAAPMQRRGAPAPVVRPQEQPMADEGRTTEAGASAGVLAAQSDPRRVWAAAATLPPAGAGSTRGKPSRARHAAPSAPQPGPTRPGAHRAW